MLPFAALRLRVGAGVEQAAARAVERAAREAERRAGRAAEVAAVALLTGGVDGVVAAAGQGRAVRRRGGVDRALREVGLEVLRRVDHGAGHAVAGLRLAVRVEELGRALGEVGGELVGVARSSRTTDSAFRRQPAYFEAASSTADEHSGPASARRRLDRRRAPAASRSERARDDPSHGEVLRGVIRSCAGPLAHRHARPRARAAGAGRNPGGSPAPRSRIGAAHLLEVEPRDAGRPPLA